MILKNGRRERIDMGPGSGLGQLGHVNVVNVIPSVEQDIVSVGGLACANCPNPVRVGSLTCSYICHRAFMCRWTIGG